MGRVSESDGHACARSSITTRVPIAASLLLDSPAWLLAHYPTRHGTRFRLSILRHTGRRSSRWPWKSRTKFKFFIFLQDLCPRSIHPPPPARLSPWANFFPTLERKTLQIVCMFHFHCYLLPGLTQIVIYKGLCVDDTEFRTMISDPSMSLMLPLGSPRRIRGKYRIDCGMCRHSTN